jgi:hypothetical protein
MVTKPASDRARIPIQDNPILKPYTKYLAQRVLAPRHPWIPPPGYFPQATGTWHLTAYERREGRSNVNQYRQGYTKLADVQSFSSVSPSVL